MTPWTFPHGKKELFQLRQFVTNFLRNKNDSTVTFVLNQTDRTSVLANDRQSDHKNPLRRPLLLNTRESGSIILSFHV